MNAFFFFYLKVDECPHRVQEAQFVLPLLNGKHSREELSAHVMLAGDLVGIFLLRVGALAAKVQFLFGDLVQLLVFGFDVGDEIFPVLGCAFRNDVHHARVADLRGG